MWRVIAWYVCIRGLGFVEVKCWEKYEATRRDGQRSGEFSCAFHAGSPWPCIFDRLRSTSSK